MRNKIVIYILVFAFLGGGAGQTFAQSSDAQSKRNWRGEYTASVTAGKSGKNEWRSTYEKYVWPGKRGTTDLPGAVTEAENAVNEKLRMNVLKLVPDAKAASNAMPFPRPQTQSPHRNNLSKGAKIAIGVAVAVGVVAVIFLVKRCRNEMGCGAGQ